MNSQSEDSVHPVHPVEGLQEILRQSRVWERSTFQVVAQNLSEKAAFEGCLAEALRTLKNPDGGVAFKAVHLILASTQSRPRLPMGIGVVEVEGSTLEVMCSAIRQVPSGDVALLVNIEEYWAGAADSGGPKSGSWVHPHQRARSPLGRVATNLTATIKALHLLAEDTGISIVATTALAVGQWDRLEAELGDLPNLLWCDSGGDLESEMDDEWLIRGVQSVKDGTLTLDELRSRFETNLEDPIVLQSAWAQVLASLGRPYEAWEAMKPVASGFGARDVSQMIRIAQIASEALDIDAALEWIDRARNSGIRIYQDWCNVVVLVQSIGSANLESDLMGEMARHFPDEEAVTEWHMRSAIVNGDLSRAASFARKMGNAIRGALLEEVATGKVVLSELKKRSLPLEELAFGLQALANHWLAKGNALGAFRAAAEVPKGTGQELPSLRVRWKALGMLSKKQGTATDDHAELLKHLISATLPFSQDADIRRLIDEVCDDEMTPRTHFLLFSFLTNQLLDPILGLATDRPWRGLAAKSTETTEPSEIVPFMESLHRSQPSNVVVLGNAVLPDSLRDQATPKLACAILELLDFMDPEPQLPERLVHLLFSLECIARHLGDPTTDMLAALHVVKRTAMIGDGQSARNIAEHILQRMPDTQPAFKEWRLGIAWLAMAEARVSSGSAYEGIRCLCFALTCLHGGVEHAEIVAEAFNIAGRAMREMGLTSICTGGVWRGSGVGQTSWR